MIVPDYWTQARRSQSAHGRSFTVRRLGWSNLSQQDAQAMADQRADEALQGLIAGNPMPRIERKTPYLGADGVPIREEVLSRHGDNVITRNVYGAHCLNTPDLLIADVDFSSGAPLHVSFASLMILLLAALAAGTICRKLEVAAVLAIMALIFNWSLASIAFKLWRRLRGGNEKLTRKRCQDFLQHHPDWALRLYRTPAGMRILATHRPFSAREPETLEFLTAVGADPMYVRLCRHQACFRARLTAKPWRIGLQPSRPRAETWPVRPEHLGERQAWTARYDALISRFAACRLIGTLGSDTVAPQLAGTLTLHDECSHALVEGLRLG